MAGRSTFDRRTPVRCVLHCMGRLIELPQISDKVGHIIGLVSAKRDQVIAGAGGRHLQRGLAFNRSDDAACTAPGPSRRAD